MSGIYMAMEIARKALIVNQVGMQVTANNVANVNTPGYSRQEAVITEAGASSYNFGQLGLGAVIGGIRRNVDAFTESQLTFESGVYSSLDYTARSVGQVEGIFNDTSGASLADRVTGFYNAWDDLSSNPQGTAERQTVASTAELLAAGFRQIDSRLSTLKSDANKDVATLVGEINQTVAQIADLNGNIKIATAQGRQANDLLDQRGVLLKSLAGKVGYTTVTDSLGMVNVYVGNGRVLVDGETAGSLVADVDPTNPEPVFDVKIRVPGQDSPASSLDTITTSISGGQLASAIRFRDGYLETVRERVDRLAYAIGTQANAQHAVGYGLAVGSPPTVPTGMNFFSPLSSVTGASRDFRVDPAIAADTRNIAAAETPLPGDNRNSLLMAGLRNIPMSALGDSAIPDYIAGMLGQIGSETRSVDLDMKHQKTVVDYLETRREEISGVSLDEEMTNLIKFQRAFEASTKMIAVVDQLLDSIIQMRG